MAENSYVQVPPDSTGKKLQTVQHTIGANVVQAQAYHLSDPVNPTQIQNVDNRGQASVRFAEGSPSLDAFGNLRVSNAHILGGYEYSNDAQSDLFQDELTGVSSIVWQAGKAYTTMGVDNSSNSSAKRTTNRYHFYQPGVGNLIIQTLFMGDSGKAGNVRRWGYYGRRNGLFWELDGTTLAVAIRSHVTGTITDNKVTRANWNGDKLDGTGPSGMTLDLTKANFFWIDFAWLGVGPARFGILAEDGSRWVCHTFENPNNISGPYMARGSLPIRYENYNTTTTSGTSEMHMICAAVYSESDTDYVFWRFADVKSNGAVTVNTDTPLFTMRPQLYIFDGHDIATGTWSGGTATITTSTAHQLVNQDDVIISGCTPSGYNGKFENVTVVDSTTIQVTMTSPGGNITIPGTIMEDMPNRTGIYPDHLSIFVSGGTIELSILDEPTITSPTWQPCASLAEFSTAGTLTGGDVFRSWFLGPGVHNIDLTSIYETNDEGYHVYPDGSNSQKMSLVATKVDGTTVTVRATLGYRELN